MVRDNPENPEDKARPDPRGHQDSRASPEDLVSPDNLAHQERRARTHNTAPVRRALADRSRLPEVACPPPPTPLRLRLHQRSRPRPPPNSLRREAATASSTRSTERCGE